MRPIDAGALLEKMKHRKEYIGRPSDPVCLVEDAPTIDVEPVKHGHWTKEALASTSGGTYDVVRCSVCKDQIPLWKTNYCPNCGAKMDEVVK